MMKVLVISVLLIVAAFQSTQAFISPVAVAEEYRRREAVKEANKPTVEVSCKGSEEVVNPNGSSLITFKDSYDPSNGYSSQTITIRKESIVAVSEAHDRYYVYVGIPDTEHVIEVSKSEYEQALEAMKVG